MYLLQTHSYEASTQAYAPSTTPPIYQRNHYDYQSTTTTEKYNTPRNDYYTEKSTQRSTYPPSINKYSVSTTRSPYDFKDFYSRTSKPTPQKHGFYSKDEFDKYFKATTKSPHSDKEIKSVFKFGTYYSQKSSDNSIRPDANSQQVQIEPARLVHSYTRNLTTGELVHK